MPPAGLILGALQIAEGARDVGVRLIVVAVLAAAVWTLLLVVR